MTKWQERTLVALVCFIIGAIVTTAALLIVNDGQFRYHRVFTSAKTTDIEGGHFGYLYDNRFHSVCYIFRDTDTHQVSMSCVKTADSVQYHGGSERSM